MPSAFGVISSRSDFFSKMGKVAGGQHFQHPLKKLEVHWVQLEDVIPFPKTASLSFCNDPMTSSFDTVMDTELTVY